LKADILNASKDKIQLVMFYADYCGPCKALKPVLQKLGDKYGVHFLDAQKEGQLVSQYGIRSVPTVFFFYKEKIAGGFLGYTPATKIEQLLEQMKDN